MSDFPRQADPRRPETVYTEDEVQAMKARLVRQLNKYRKRWVRLRRRYEAA